MTVLPLPIAGPVYCERSAHVSPSAEAKCASGVASPWLSASVKRAAASQARAHPFQPAPEHRATPLLAGGCHAVLWESLPAKVTVFSLQVAPSKR